MKRALLVVLVACDPPPVTMDQWQCPSSGTPLTYDNFGSDFFTGNCNLCHSAEGDARQGAPEAFRFDTLDGVHAHASRIFVRAAGPNTTMPPGPSDPSLDERNSLADWLACGAP